MANHTLALRHQFDNVAQQKDASTLGMWIFLVTEVLFFGGMFCCYTVYRALYPSAFGHAQQSSRRDPGRRQHGGAHLQQLYHGVRREQRGYRREERAGGISVA